MPVTHQTYERLALEDPDSQWELHHGRLREKPPMTIAHNRLTMEVGYELRRQLDRDHFDVRINMGRLRYTDSTYYVPDVMVIPTSLIPPGTEHVEALEAYGEPVPLVVEVWSPSTGTYDVDAKLPEYRRRGDAEIWRVHPKERTLTVWRRQADGSYAQSVHTSGALEPVALPGVRLDLDALFSFP